MAVKKPKPHQIRMIAEEIGLDITDDDITSYINLTEGDIRNLNRLDRMPDHLPEVKYPRTRGYQPEGEENRYNAWYFKTSIEGAAEGKLKGKNVVLKDTIMVEGVPMMNGASILEGYVPDFDATVVNRILDAGGKIVGKANSEYLGLCGASHTSVLGPVQNPHKEGYSAGGSSSGVGALIAAGEVEMGIGGDQGGSIRMPAAFSGVYGMKPTHGLVPYSGIMSMDPFLDHAGPLSATVYDNALLLEVIAGPDGIDTRQQNVRTHPYTEMLEKGIEGLKIGIVQEGFGRHNSEQDVDDKVRSAVEEFKKMGVSVEEVSIPMHLDVQAIYAPIGIQGIVQSMMWMDGVGIGRPDIYSTSLIDTFRRWRYRVNELSETGKLYLLEAAYLKKYHGFRYYAKAMNLVRKLTDAYNATLAKYDLLVMPTLPMKATPIPGPDASIEDDVARSFEMNENTMTANITHHPAMSVPCGMSDGLPVGMMIVGKHFEESTIYRAAYAFEQGVDWKSR